MATTTVGWKHPYPTFYWEHQPTGGAWQDAVNLSGYTSGQGTDTLDLAGATEAETGFLRCKLSNPSGGLVHTDIVNLTATVTAPNITVGISAQTPYEGESAVYGPITVTGSPTPTLLWEAETVDGNNTWADADTVFGADGSGQGTTSYTIANTQPADNRDVRVVATNTEGSDTSQAALTVTPQLAFVTQPQNLEITATGASEYFHDFATKLIGDWTHTRVSSATAPDELGVIQTYTSGQPAWYRDDGLQLEDQKTNYCQRSNDFGAWPWQVRGSALVGTTESAPDGSNTASSLSLFNSSANDIYQQTSGHSVSVTLSPSVWVKSLNNNNFQIANPDSSARGQWEIDGALLSGAWELITESHAAVTVTNAFTSSAGGAAGLHFREIGGVATATLHVWGAQLEEGGFPTSHAPTAGAAYTRTATNCSATFAELGDPLPAGGVVNDYCGQIVFVMQHDFADVVAGRIFDIGDGTSTNRCYMYMSTDFRGRFTIGGASTSFRFTGVRFNKGDTVDIRFVKRSSGDSVFWLNGNKLTATITTDHAVALTNVSLGNGAEDIRYNGYYSKFRLVPEALTDEQIEAWT